MVQTICYSVSVRILGVIRLTHQHLWRCSVSSEQTTVFSLTSSSELRLLCSDNLMANCTNHDPAGLGLGSSIRWASPDNKGNMVVCWQDNTFVRKNILLFNGKYWVTLPSAFANHCVRRSAVNVFTRYSSSTVLQMLVCVSRPDCWQAVRTLIWLVCVLAVCLALLCGYFGRIWC